MDARVTIFVYDVVVVVLSHLVVGLFGYDLLPRFNGLGIEVRRLKGARSHIILLALTAIVGTHVPRVVF